MYLILSRHNSNVGDYLILERAKNLVATLKPKSHIERDVVRRVVAQNRDPHQVRISDVMTTPVVSIPSNEDVTAAAQLMKEKGIRRLAVMQGPKLVGIITTDDLTRHMMRVVEEFATALYIMERRTDYDREFIRRATR